MSYLRYSRAKILLIYLSYAVFTKNFMYYFCTYFDRSYLLKGLTLYFSLCQHIESFILYILCLDDFTFQTISLLNLANIKAVSLTQLETSDKHLLQVKKNRSKVEYYFTCSPILPLYLLETFPYINAITYLDSDLFFYSNPNPIFQELENNSILIMPHHYSRKGVEKLNLYGKYNVGFLTFCNDINAKECLSWWREKCLSWCFARVENDLFADQKYLDEWPKRFKGVKILDYKGANIAFWNWEQYKYSKQGQNLYIDDQKLIFCHFSQFKQINSSTYIISYGKKYFTPYLIRKYCVKAYVKQLKLAHKWLANEKNIHLQPEDLYFQSNYFQTNYWVELLVSIIFGNIIIDFNT
ncbi:MAG: hypothetical protein WAQ98_31815 [Blastocatellia bacterium]